MTTTQKNCGKKAKTKIKFSKNWCEKAANLEKGCVVAAGDGLTKEQIDYLQGKKKKIKGLSQVIKEQERFIEQVNLTLKFLKMYEGNPSDFKVMLGEDIIKHYRFDECWDNAEWVWESIDELTCDIVYKNKKFTFTANGIFSALHFGKATPKNFMERLNENWLVEGEWGI
jgi:hypothetical protein